VSAGTTGSPALFAGVAAGEEAAMSAALGATGVNGSKIGGSSVPLVPLVLSMGSISDPCAETLLRTRSSED